VEDRGRACHHLLPMTPGYRALDRVGENDGRQEPELTPGAKPILLLRGRGPMLDTLPFPFITDRDLPARSAYQMQTRANGPSAFLECLGAAVVPLDGPGGQEVRQTRQRLRNIVTRGIEHLLPGGAVGSSSTRQLGHRRIQESRPVGEQGQGLRR
jgi:hypothetical protein